MLAKARPSGYPPCPQSKNSSSTRSIASTGSDSKFDDFHAGFRFKEFRQLGTGSLRYEALRAGQVDVVVAFSTDGQISGLGLVLLEDDKRFYPAYQAAPVVRAQVLQQHPKIAEALNRLAGLLTEEVMAGLNWQVDGPDKREFAAVARAFLEEKG